MLNFFSINTYSWKISANFPFTTVQQVFEDMEPIENALNNYIHLNKLKIRIRLVGPEENVEEKNLRHHIYYVKDFDENVEACYIGAPTPSEAETRNIGNLMQVPIKPHDTT